jgi:glucosamine--fructose-6-phosphate aminotransferase (isomerizing)
LAKSLISEEHIYLIGKHLNYPAALEFALKLKESSYLHAEAFAAGELKPESLPLFKRELLALSLFQKMMSKKKFFLLLPN